MAVKETLRYEIGADDKDLLDALKRSIAAVKKAAAETAAAGEAAAAHDKQRSDATARYVQSLEREVAFVSRVSKEEQALWEVEKGRYKDIDQASKQRIIQLAREADQARAAANAQKEAQREAEKAAESAKQAAASSASIGATNPFARVQGGVKEFFAGANDQIGKLASATGGLSKGASLAIGSLTAIGGGPVTAGLAGLAIAVGYVKDKIDEKRKAAEEAEKVIREKAEAEAKAAAATRAEYEKAVALLGTELELRRQAAAMGGKFDSGEAQKVIELDAANRKLREAVDATRSLREERERALAVQTRAERALRGAGGEDSAPQSVIKDAKLAAEKSRELYAKIDESVKAEGAARQSILDIQKKNKLSDDAAVLAADAEKAQAIVDAAARERESARAALVQLDVAARVVEYERAGASAAVARARAELDYADQLIKSKDAQARAMELTAMRRKLDDAVAAEARSKAKAVDDLAKTTIATLEQEIATVGKRTKAEQTRYDVEHGRLAAADEGQKQEILGLSETLARTERITAAEKERVAAITSYLDALAKEQAAKTFATKTEEVLYEIQSNRLAAATAEQQELALLEAARIDGAKKREELDKAVADRRTAFERDIAALIQQTSTPEEQRNAKLAEYKALLDAGVISTGQYAQAQELLAKSLEKAAQKHKEKSEAHKLEEESLKRLKDLGMNVAQSLGDQFVEFFFDPQKANWEDWSKNVAKQVAKAMIQMLALRAISALNPGVGAVAAGVAGAVTAADGGYITGPGTTTSDSIPAWLSNKEFVQPAKAVDHYGVGFMEDIRRLRFPRFASGGLVGGGGGVGRAMAPVAAASFRIVNVLDPSVVADFMASSEGEQIFTNYFTNHPDRYRGAMGG